MPCHPLSTAAFPGLNRLFCRTTALLSLPFIVMPVQALAQDEQQEVIELSPIVLQAIPYTGEIDGYLAPGTETGVKSGVPLAEVPQSISVVTSTELERRAPAQVEDAIKYTVGVNASTWGNDDRFDQFSIRGFDLGSGALYRDGLPQKVVGFTAFSSHPYMLERVDVLRGPAGVLYGSNDAGGMVNLVTKRPVFERKAEARLGYGSHGNGEVGFDFGDALDARKTVAGRITGLWRDGATEIDNSEDDRAFLAGGLTWAPTDYTSLTLLAHVQKDARTPSGMFPIAGEDYDLSLGVLPRDFAYRSSPYNQFKTDQQSLGLELTHEFSSELVLNARARYAHQNTDYRHAYRDRITAAGISYTALRQDESAKTLGADVNLEWRRAFGAANNSLTVGVDYQHADNDADQYYQTGAFMIGFNDPSLDFLVEDPSLSSRNRETYTEKGLYLQDHLNLGQGTTITAGLRRSWLESRNEDLLGAGGIQRKDDAATTAMIGATHEFANGLTPYLNYSEGFIQNAGTTIDGDPLDPSRNKQLEAGLRYMPPFGDLLLSAAVFDLRKTNVEDYYFDEDGNIDYTHSTQVGEIRARGVELEARGKLTQELQGVLGYTYLDTEITESADPAKRGKENVMSPRHQVSLWLDWDASRFMPGLSVGGGLRYQSDSYSTQYNGRVTPSHTTADLAMRYEADQYAVDLGVTNLFDKEYYGVCYDNLGCALGDGRKVSLTLSRNF
ncbi:TonB-dependent siderophore receptor [Paracoccus saliphilus]|uniref:Iron complex outermembrane recepter protein n=1 Tax=Paracoccus saliphilus TaxID=405559 RepID=A0AA46A6K3_9RHOB|nr:TonB-dependent siderophore receptor [Paracoccus saliphilus]WCR01522.1 TonB-dependent siderophore receptor [Paracoccus saliphilus]SIS99290.1 iron complex outermembrane recepter protein [Paracoccus saliphilus]